MATLRDLVLALGDEVGWALVGGLAVSARAEPRFTRDIVLAVAVNTDDEAERLVADLGVQGWSMWAVVEQQAVDRLAQVRLRSAAVGQATCDLLFASAYARKFVEGPRRPGACIARPTREGYRVVSRPRRTPRGACLGGAGPDELPGVSTCSGIESEIVTEAESLEIVPELILPVARVGHLIALKLLSTSETRRQDELDLAALAKVARLTDWAMAEVAVRLITDRGFSRGRDLAAALSGLRGSVTSPDHPPPGRI